MGEAYEPRSGCPNNATIEVFGDRWSLLVLRDIAFGDRAISESCRPAQKRDRLNILPDRLKRLVELELLTDRHRVVAPAQDRAPCQGSAPKPCQKV
jgi:DNA-binding HxlR family transcriptional regulator